MNPPRMRTWKNAGACPQSAALRVTYRDFDLALVQLAFADQHLLLRKALRSSNVHFITPSTRNIRMQHLALTVGWSVASRTACKLRSGCLFLCPMSHSRAWP